MDSKLQAKNFITIGIFTAIYFVIFFATGMMGYIPIFFLLLPIMIPITTSIPFALFLTKVKKFGMVTIMGLLLGFFMFLTGHTWVPIISGVVFGLLADIILKAGNYSSFKHTVPGFAVFSVWAIGAMLPLWLMRESYFDYIESSMGVEYADKIVAITPTWVLFALIAATFITGVIGAFIGRAVLKKHFQKAGIV